MDTHPLCCENHLSPPVANFACYVRIHILPEWSFFISAVFLNSSGTFWTRNIVHYLLQQYLTTFFVLLKNYYMWTIVVFTTNPSIGILTRIFSLWFHACTLQFLRILRLILTSHNYEIHMSCDSEFHTSWANNFQNAPSPPKTNDLSQISEIAFGEHNWSIPIERTFKINFF